jgi:hypothetical protein
MHSNIYLSRHPVSPLFFVLLVAVFLLLEELGKFGIGFVGEIIKEESVDRP